MFDWALNTPLISITKIYSNELMCKMAASIYKIIRRNGRLRILLLTHPNFSIQAKNLWTHAIYFDIHQNFN